MDDSGVEGADHNLDIGPGHERGYGTAACLDQSLRTISGFELYIEECRRLTTSDFWNSHNLLKGWNRVTVHSAGLKLDACMV